MNLLICGVCIMGGLWQVFTGLFSRALFEIFLIAGGAALFALLKAKWPKIAAPLVYALAAAAFLSVLLVNTTRHPFLSQETPLWLLASAFVLILLVLLGKRLDKRDESPVPPASDSNDIQVQ